ncbi:unnamed protein product [Phaedon cochleariae]|uniref:C-type lectin domain-containing protein n=1 Tax=Phaedon cochleariae TaxID=80249 RepID=A0A9P0DQ10_PHACE|nr:unnamed protein product [Phaedon cochleariae]
MKVMIALVCICLFFSIGNAERAQKIEKIWNDNEGVWWPILEDWAVSGNNRQGRVMMIPISPNAYVAEEKAGNVTRESKVVPGKIVSTNGVPGNLVPAYTNNYVNKKPLGRQVSETDLYLLGAIEKLVYKVDFMEKRLRRVEEMLYYAMAGNRIDTEPCQENFTKVGSDCYHFNSGTGREFDWKVASKHCKKLGGFLAEMETIEENQDLITYILGSQILRGRDFWVGGLNPGLLWIWSHSARPVAAPGSQTNKENPSAAIQGEGRCLRIAYNPALRAYAYKGTDCSLRYNFVCEAPETTSSNEIRRLGRERKIFGDEL